MSEDDDTKNEVCPVDSATRAAWLESRTTNSSLTPVDKLRDTQSRSQEKQCDSFIAKTSGILGTQKTRLKSLWESIVTWPAPPEERRKSEDCIHNQKNAVRREAPVSLGLHREVSTIPRAHPDLSQSNETQEIQPMANCEKESGVSPEGNWIYPSEKMFYDAMRRKGYSSQVRDMKTIVPIHNAVNEQAWKEIKEWEKPWLGEKCDGPKLHSFKGLPSSMTPKARINTWLGYTAPFDRHDWTIDRCGTRVEYVIDFYVGKNQGKRDGKLNFFLDVRPKLNTWEGWKMRSSKLLGLS